jgi:hypothetical protein
MRTSRQDESLRAVVPHQGNLRTALGAQLDRGEFVNALRIVASVPVDVAPERCRLIDELVPLVESSSDNRRDEVLGRAHLAASNLEFERGGFQAGADHGRRAGEVFEALGDARSVAWSSFLETFGAWGVGDIERARAAISDARRRFEDLGDRVGQANAAWAAILLDPDFRRADELGEFAESELRSIDSPFALAHCLEARALVDLQQDRIDRAGPWLREALEIFGRLRISGCVAHCLEASAAFAVASHGGVRPAQVAELLGAADGLRTASGHRHRPWELGGQRAALTALRRSMTGDELERAVAAGRGHRLESALAFGEQVLDD